jgi:hypothetical protein
LSSTTLGSGVINSSLTSIGTQASGVNIATGQTYKINSTDVLSSTALGTGVLSSSLTSVGKLSGLAVGTDNADALALVTMSSTSKGLLIPRMTTAQKSAITGTVPTGLLVYDTTLLALNHYNGSAWSSISGTASNPVVLSITSANSGLVLTTATDVVICTASAGAIVVTLPNPVGISGKIFRLIRTDTTLANPISIDTASGKTIGGVLIRRMYTANETWNLVSDGANYQVISHQAQTNWTTTPTLTITAVTTAPTKGTATINRDENVWRRDGSDLLCTAVFAKSANGTATIGSGDYLFALPLGLTHTLPVYTGAGDQFKNYPMGTCYSIANGSKIVLGIALPYSTTTYRLLGFSPTDSNSISSIYNQITASADLVYSATYRCPITNWDE